MEEGVSEYCLGADDFDQCGYRYPLVIENRCRVEGREGGWWASLDARDEEEAEREVQARLSGHWIYITAVRRTSGTKQSKTKRSFEQAAKCHSATATYPPIPLPINPPLNPSIVLSIQQGSRETAATMTPHPIPKTYPPTGTTNQPTGPLKKHIGRNENAMSFPGPGFVRPFIRPSLHSAASLTKKIPQKPSLTYDSTRLKRPSQTDRSSEHQERHRS